MQIIPFFVTYWKHKANVFLMGRQLCVGLTDCLEMYVRRNHLNVLSRCPECTSYILIDVLYVFCMILFSWLTPWALSNHHQHHLHNHFQHSKDHHCRHRHHLYQLHHYLNHYHHYRRRHHRQRHKHHHLRHH